jgi:FlaA1/EpsC-like NDP-sugar epimerase
MTAFPLAPFAASDTEGRVALITGGTGSFGTAVLHRFLGMNFKEIRVFSRDEKKQEDMRIALKNDRVKFYLGDVREASSLQPAMVDVDLIFHAAALKQVPSCEFYPMEAIRTNVLGAENVLETAVRFGVPKVIVLSTDKAVYPINAMGMTKALMEKLTIAKARTISSDRTVLCAFRLSGQGGQADHGDGPQHDPLPDVAGGFRRSGALRRQECAAGRSLRPESAGSQNRGAGGSRAAHIQE